MPHFAAGSWTFAALAPPSPCTLRRLRRRAPALSPGSGPGAAAQPSQTRQVSPGRVAEGSWLTRLSVHLPRPAARTEAAFGVGTLTPSRSRSGRPLPTGSTPAARLARLRSRRLPLPAALPLWTHLSRRRHPPRLTAGSTRDPLSQREAKAQGAQRYARGVILAPVSLNSGHDRWSYTSPCGRLKKQPPRITKPCPSKLYIYNSPPLPEHTVYT